MMPADTSADDPIQKFFAVTHASPDAIAVSGDEDLSYGQMGRRVRQLAAWIAEQTGKQHPRVIISLPQGAAAYTGMLATLAAGGQYCPLNLEMPAPRRVLIGDMFEPDVALVAGNSREGLPEGVQVLDIEKAPDLQLGAPRAPGEVAYTIFTSGSTGTPKGVVVGRSGLGHFLNWAIPCLELGPGRRCSQHPNISFDLSVIDIYGALCSGATLVPLVGSKDRLMPGLAVRDNSIDVWISVPSVIDLMSRAGQATPEMLGNVRTYYFCGEPLLPAHLEAVFTASPHATVINAYGPTEATVSCTELKLTAGNFRQACSTTCAIGEAIEGMTISLDGGSTESEGEIVISGPQVALEYWREEALTAKSYGVDPLNGQRFFRTGDWAERIDGHLYFVGRIDRQIKLHGHRVELGEIDSALRKLLSGEAVATVFSEGNIVSFVERSSVDAARLRAALSETLPDYMVPHEIRAIEHLPRSANDKIDFRALAALSA